MKKISFIIGIFVFLSCSSEVDESKLFLFNDTYLQLEDGELTNELTKENTDLYFSMLGNSDIQAPLYKHITSDEYQLYVGLPIGSDFNSIKKMISTDDAIEGKIENISGSYIYVNYLDMEKNITKYLIEVDKNLVLLILVSDSKSNLKVNDVASITNRLITE